MSVLIAEGLEVNGRKLSIYTDRIKNYVEHNLTQKYLK